MQMLAKQRDFVWNYLGLFFRMGTTFLVLPLVLTLLTDEGLGMWYVFLAVNSFVTTFSAGFAPSFARLVTYCWSGAKTFEKEGVSSSTGDRVDYRLFSTLIIAAKSIYFAIAVTVLIIISTLGTVYVVAVSSGLEFLEFVPAWFVFCVGVFLNIYYAYYESLLRGIGDFTGVNKSTIYSNIFWFASALVLLLLGCDLLALATAFTVQGFSCRYLSKRYFFGHHEILRGLNEADSPTREEIRHVVKTVAPNSVKDTVVSLANYLMSTSSTIICSVFLPLASTGTYSVTMQLFNAIATMSSVVLTTYAPSLQSAYSNGNVNLEKLLTGRVYFGLIAVYFTLSAALIVVGFPIIRFMRPSFEVDGALVVLMLIYYFEWRLFSTSATLITYTNRIPYMISFVVSAVVGVLISTLLVSQTPIGVAGLILGQAIAQIYNAAKWPYIASRRVGSTVGALVWSGALDAVDYMRRRVTGGRKHR